MNESGKIYLKKMSLEEGWRMLEDRLIQMATNEQGEIIPEFAQELAKMFALAPDSELRRFIVAGSAGGELFRLLAIVAIGEATHRIEELLSGAKS